MAKAGAERRHKTADVSKYNTNCRSTVGRGDYIT